MNQTKRLFHEPCFIPIGYSTPVVERFDRVSIRFEGSYAQVAYELEDYFAVTVYNEMFDRYYERATFDNFDVYEGKSEKLFHL